MSRTHRRSSAKYLERHYVTTEAQFRDPWYQRYLNKRHPTKTIEELNKIERNMFHSDMYSFNAPKYFRQIRNYKYRFYAKNALIKQLQYTYDVVINDPKSDVNYYWY